MLALLHLPPSNHAISKYNLIHSALTDRDTGAPFDEKSHLIKELFHFCTDANLGLDLQPTLPITHNVMMSDGFTIRARRLRRMPH